MIKSIFIFLSYFVPRPSSLVLLLILLLPVPARAELLDRVVASVNHEIITLTELNQAAGFNAALSGNDPHEEKLRAETLDGLINRQLLLQEAYRLRFVELSDEDIRAEIEKLKKRLGPDNSFTDFLERLDITPEQLGRMLGDRLLVQRFIEKKIGLFVRVGRDEAQDYFNGHPEEFKGKRFPEVQKAIIQMLSMRKLDQQTAQYLEELKSKAEIRVNR